MTEAREIMLAARKAANMSAFTADHYWAAHVLHSEAPDRYRSAAQVVRAYADALDAYANSDDFPGLAALAEHEEKGK